MKYVEDFNGKKMTVKEMEDDILSIVKEKCDWVNLDDTPEDEINEYHPSLSNDELDNEITSHMNWQNKSRGLDVSQDTLFEKKTVFSIPSDGDLYVVVYSSDAGLDFVVQVILTEDGEYDELKLGSVTDREYSLLFDKTRTGGDW